MANIPYFKDAIRRGLNQLGFDLVRLQNSPRRTLLGLSRLSIGSIIDVGANEGQFAREIITYFPGARLYCFEPLKGPFDNLLTWAQTQRGQVRCFQLALGDKAGEMGMHEHERHTPSSSLLPATDRCHQLYPQTDGERITRVRTATLDQALEGVLDTALRDVLLKLDVQGFEDRVLRGGSRVLSQCRAVVLEASLEPLYEGQADFYTLVQLLREAELLYAGNLDQAYGSDGRVVYLDAVFVRP